MKHQTFYTDRGKDNYTTHTYFDHPKCQLFRIVSHDENCWDWMVKTNDGYSNCAHHWLDSFDKAYEAALAYAESR